MDNELLKNQVVKAFIHAGDFIKALENYVKQLEQIKAEVPETMMAAELNVAIKNVRKAQTIFNDVKTIMAMVHGRVVSDRTTEV